MTTESAPRPTKPDPYDPANRRCGTCRWHDVDGFYRFYGTSAEGFGDYGYCRRTPPMPDIVPLLARFQDKEALATAYVVGAVWPETAEDEWCGEWAQDARSKARAAGGTEAPEGPEELHA
jgi:hypothetical protein